jgi:UDP-2,3-diacylglucosamine hydrolase
MHGDQLCTDDLDYQRFRAMVRTPAWRSKFLAEPLERRRAVAQSFRETSHRATRDKSEITMDVNQEAVEEALRRHAADLLIHGHTHRPGVHDFEVNGRGMSRVVLGDWYRQGSVLTVTEGEYCDLSVLDPRDPLED